jgi:hypothetical protein
LGFLNTRQRPQLLTGRQDFALLMLALSPLVLAPLAHWLGGGLRTALLCAGVLTAAVWLLAPRGRTWVVYNLSLPRARQAVLETLRSMGLTPQETDRGVELEGEPGAVEIENFPILRNVSLRLQGGRELLWNAFSERLSDRLRDTEVEPSPTAVALLLVATAMIVAPLALMVHHAPEIVRIVTDLLP